MCVQACCPSTWWGPLAPPPAALWTQLARWASSPRSTRSGVPLALTLPALPTHPASAHPACRPGFSFSGSSCRRAGGCCVKRVTLAEQFLLSSLQQQDWPALIPQAGPARLQKHVPLSDCGDLGRRRMMQIADGSDSRPHRQAVGLSCCCISLFSQRAFPFCRLRVDARTRAWLPSCRSSATFRCTSWAGCQHL